MQIARNHTGHRVGEMHSKAKLTDQQVREMREIHGQGIGYRRLAKRFGCGISTVRDIVLYRTRRSA
jgi:transposase